MLATRRRKALPYAMAALWGATHQADVRAQQSEALPEPLRVEVTGSRIARIDGETALPVQVIGRDEIERGNWTTAAELLSFVSANFGGANNATSAGTLSASRHSRTVGCQPARAGREPDARAAQRPAPVELRFRGARPSIFERFRSRPSTASRS